MLSCGSVGRLLHSSANATKNLNNAFIYLAEWIDATGSALNNMQNDISDIKNKNENEKSLEFLNNESEIKEDVTKLIKKFDELEESFVNYKTDDVSEIKSLLTGIIVQLNTALTPDIDSLNERIDKLSEENSNKLTELETLMQEKINQQSKQISALEEKIETLSSKFDKLIEAMSEDSKNYEIKDILNYIATQIATTNETLANQQDNNKVLNTVAEKLSSFDENINKVVSYIEED